VEEGLFSGINGYIFSSESLYLLSHSLDLKEVFQQRWKLGLWLFLSPDEAKSFSVSRIKQPQEEIFSRL